MANKKIFFCYANAEMEQNPKLIQAIKLHFSRLKGNADLIFKEEQFAIASDKEKIIDLIKNADCKIHLLSINYANEEDCMNQLHVSLEKVENNFPILLSAFFWDESSPFEKLEDKMLPAKNKPLETQPNLNTSLMELVKSVAEEGLGMKSSLNNEQNYYYLLAAIVFIIGIAVAIFAYFKISLSIAILSVIMFSCISLFVLIKVWKPTSISLFKF